MRSERETPLGDEGQEKLEQEIVSVREGGVKKKKNRHKGRLGNCVIQGKEAGLIHKGPLTFRKRMILM